MKILIIGAGGREHAIAWKLTQNDNVTKIYAATGNAYNTLIDNCENIHLTTTDELLDFAKQQQIDLTIVGSEALLVEGIVDVFQENGLNIFGANKHAAMLEGSKSIAKDFMQKYGVKTATSATFTDAEQANNYITNMDCPIVIKASGLAAGKGVLICQNHTDAQQAIQEIMVEKVFGDAGETVVIEEFLDGFEVSILSVTDSKTILPFISAKDHKKIGEGETGLNTGGMGVVAPNPLYTADIEQAFVTQILQPTLTGMQAEGMDFAGVIFFGLMVTTKGVYLLEYNMRLGDPETQAVLPLLNTDLLEIIEHAHSKTLADITLDWKDKHSCCVVMVAGGYPEQYHKGDEIRGLTQFVQDAKDTHQNHLFLAGVTSIGSNYQTNGGRVLNIVSLADTLEQAQQKAYESIQSIDFNNCYYRSDIGRK